MKKSVAGLLLVVVLAIMVGFGYIMMNGVDENGSGALKNTKLGLDLAGGVSITYQAVGEVAPSPTDISDTIEKLRKRVEKYSTESGVYQEGDDRISIEIPGVKDAEAVLADLGSPGQLYFIKAMGPDGNMNYDYRSTASGLPVYSEGDNLCVFFGTADAFGYFVYDEATNELAFDAEGNPIEYKVKDMSAINREFVLTKPLDQIIAEGSAVLSGTDVAKSEGGAYTDKNEKTEFLVQLKFTEDGAKIFGEETAAVAAKSGLPGTIGIFYDGKLISVPNVQQAITGGEAQISGLSSYEEADRLAQSIRIGGLSIELQELRSNVVGAQLGADAISTSIMAGLIGVAIIMIFMIIVYRMPGLVASIALVAYTMMMMLCVNFLGITMTLPGIAGIILSIGMAVDANVIIFARIREELAIGMTVESSIKSGFDKALSAIIDGNITTLIAALVLMAIGSGTIKGFAYTLALGIVLSMITALFITKLLLNCFFALGFKDAKWIGKVKELKTINFLSKNKIYFSVSSAIIIVGIIAMVAFAVKTGDPLNYALDFKGGSATTVDFETLQESAFIDGTIVPEIEKITGDANVLWTTVNNTNQVIFKTRELTDEERDTFKDLMVGSYGVQDQKISVETISPTISGEMLRSAIMAVAIAAVCMLIYIWLRFSDIRFGASAVAALIHDVLVVVTFYACVRLSVGSTFIACILTIVGYSINATIVVFDRIRENLRADRRKRTFNIEDTVNKSISQTLTRSVFTSLTTFITVAVLYILGVSSIKEFALPLMIGIVSGTYSSVCLTGAMWNMLSKKFPQTEEDDD